ncbi:MAG: hypothetical protein FWE69_04355 [Clostridiales bacterium]|nr:hypothetical protein [Clostridiales bacterium]
MGIADQVPVRVGAIINRPSSLGAGVVMAVGNGVLVSCTTVSVTVPHAKATKNRPVIKQA